MYQMVFNNINSSVFFRKFMNSHGLRLLELVSQDAQATGGRIKLPATGFTMKTLGYFTAKNFSDFSGKEKSELTQANYVKFYLSRGHLTLTAQKKYPHGGFGGCSMVFTKKNMVAKK